MRPLTQITLAILMAIAACVPVQATELDQVNQLIDGFKSHRVSYSIKMSKDITLGLQQATGTVKLYVGNTPQDLEQVAEIGFDYALGLGVVVGQTVGVTQQLYYDRVPPHQYVLLETSGNADFEIVSQLEEPFTP